MVLPKNNVGRIPASLPSVRVSQEVGHCEDSYCSSYSLSFKNLFPKSPSDSNDLKIAERFQTIERLKQLNIEPALWPSAIYYWDEALAKLEQDQKTALGLLEKNIRNSYSEPIASVVWGMAGDQLETIGEKEGAKHFFELADQASETVASQLWYQLKTIEQMPPEKKAESINILQKIRDRLPLLILAIRSGPYPLANEAAPGETIAAEEIYGSLDQAYALDVLSLGLLYDATLFQTKPDLEKLAGLEEEIRDSVLRRQHASPFEAKLHLNNVIRISHLVALKDYHQLEKDIRAIEAMVHPHRSATGRDFFSEGLADLHWRLKWDGLLGQDRPKEAIREITKTILPRFGNSPTIVWHLKELKKQAPHLFDLNGNFAPNVDMSQTTLGKEAALRTRSAYWISPNTAREVGIPTATGVIGAVGGFLACNFPCALLGGGLGALGGAGGNAVYNVHTSKARQAYQQSLKTGLSRISERQAFLNDTALGWSLGFATLGGLFWATPAAAGTEFAMAGFNAAARHGILRGGLKAAQVRAVGENCLRGATQLFRTLGREKFETGALYVGRFLQDNFHNIRGGGTGLAIRAGAGLTLLASDLTFLGEPWKIDHAGGAMGAAIFINEGASFIMRTDANGLLMGNLFRVGTEWLMQIQQDMPLTQPDTKRMTWASVETATMVFFAKAYVRGGDFLNKFPLGRGLMFTREALVRRFPWMATPLTSITDRGSQHFVGLSRTEIKPGKGNGNSNGNGNGHGVRLTQEGTITLPDGTAFAQSEARQPANLQALNQHGVIVEGRHNRLFSWRPRYEHRLRVGGQTIAYQDSIAPAIEQRLGRQGITRDESGRFVITQHQGVRFRGVRHIQGRGNGSRLVPVFDERMSPAVLDQVTLGGKEFNLWSGASRSKPRFTPLGAAMVAGLTGGSAWVLNRFLFSKQMRGDSEYQPLQRFSNYLASEMFTHPYVQWPLGYDKPLAQLAGRSIGVFVNLGANMLFRTYRDRWPGQVTYLQSLDQGRTEEAFENFKDNMTSLEIVPFAFEDASDDFWLWEPKAFKEYRKVHDTIIAKREAQRISHLAEVFAAQAEKERKGELPTVDRRGLRILAAYFASVLAKESKPQKQELNPLRRIEANYPSLFKDLPVLESDKDWKYFIGQVNRETDPAHDFHLYLK